mgnify:CR=1 FL=1
MFFHFIVFQYLFVCMIMKESGLSFNVIANIFTNKNATFWSRGITTVLTKIDLMNV